MIIRFLGPEMCVIWNVHPSKQGEDTVLFIIYITQIGGGNVSDGVVPQPNIIIMHVH